MPIAKSSSGMLEVGFSDSIVKPYFSAVLGRFSQIVGSDRKIVRDGTKRPQANWASGPFPRWSRVVPDCSGSMWI